MIEPIDPAILDALRRDRQCGAPVDARGRIAARLGLSPSTVSVERSVPRPAAVGKLPYGPIALSLLVGAGVGALLHATFAEPRTRIVYVERTASPVLTSSTQASPPNAPVPSSDPMTVASAARVAPPPASATVMAQLDAERALLDAARAALVQGDSDTALRALDRHARAYVRPLLREEREALFVQALVRAGRYDEARARADAFRQRSPNSLFLGAVENAIDSIP